MYKIDNIPELINLVINIFSENLKIVNKKSDSLFYFTNAGCVEMAKIIKYYFPNSNYVMRNDKIYAAIIYNDEIFDAYDGIFYSTLKKDGISEDKIIKDKNNFKIISDEEFEEFSKTFGEKLYLKGRTFEEAIIYEIEKYDFEIGDNNEKYIY